MCVVNCLKERGIREKMVKTKYIGLFVYSTPANEVWMAPKSAYNASKEKF